MKAECDACGYKPEEHSARERVLMAECEECGTLCTHCLRRAAVDNELAPHQEAEDLEGTDLLYVCQTSGRILCGDCFEKGRE